MNNIQIEFPRTAVFPGSGSYMRSRCFTGDLNTSMNVVPSLYITYDMSLIIICERQIL